jgi:hypothetical protein
MFKQLTRSQSMLPGTIHHYDTKIQALPENIYMGDSLNTLPEDPRNMNRKINLS